MRIFHKDYNKCHVKVIAYLSLDNVSSVKTKINRFGAQIGPDIVKESKTKSGHGWSKFTKVIGYLIGVRPFSFCYRRLQK